MINILFAAHPSRWPLYAPHLRRALDETGLDYTLSDDMAPETADYVIYSPNSPLRDFTPFTRAKLVQNIWAGVEEITGNETLTQPLARMVDPGLTAGMVEWVSGHVMRYHLGMDRHIVNPGHDWAPHTPPLAPQRRVAVLGLGALGSAVCVQLVALGFQVTGWARRAKALKGVRCQHGADGLNVALQDAEILVTLLPDTPDTAGIINAKTLSLMPKGAFVINPGRGPLIEDSALIAALDTGQIAGATLDVFQTEPLPEDDPYWSHPKVTVTPHIAAETRPETASAVIADNILRGEAGKPFRHLVDRAAGY